MAQGQHILGDTVLSVELEATGKGSAILPHGIKYDEMLYVYMHYICEYIYIYT